MPDHPHLPTEAREAILAWYERRGRPLAFRRTSDPYAILVSEAMAQQTQAARAAAYWERFMERFPTVESLATATPADVLRQWAGLGYDRRALALWRAARVIVDEHDAQVPASVSQLEALPGVGPYTARAVAALAYGVPVGAVDVNVRRVLGRIVAGSPDGISAKDLQVVADAAVPHDQPGTWTHAVMDVGAALCGPRMPSCADCPARPWCRYARTGPSPGGWRPRAAGDVDRAAAARRRAARRRAAREAPAPFTSTNRWLRGRILDRLRDHDDGIWVPLDDAIGEHDRDRVIGAAKVLASEGLIELAAGDDGIVRGRLALT